MHMYWLIDVLTMTQIKQNMMLVCKTSAWDSVAHHNLFFSKIEKDITSQKPIIGHSLDDFHLSGSISL